jgi:dinuclear metal center YbgI/SA1388 family protein
MLTHQLVSEIESLLNAQAIRDYCPNGLQVEGKGHIQKIVTGVTASEALIEQAILKQADAILVHHGYFWKNENACVVGMKKKRLSKLLSQDINLLAYHLPLDVHPEFGNNAQLGKLLGIEQINTLDDGTANSVLVGGVLPKAQSIDTLARNVELKLGRCPLVEKVSDDLVQRVGWCTGGGQGYIEMAAQQGMDAFITGEVSEQTIHIAREMGIHFIAAGHHATERYGVKALGQYIAETYSIDVEFVDIDNPA